MENKQAHVKMTIDLSESLKTYVNEQAEADGYMSPSEYVRELIRHDQQRKAALEELGGLILEGLRSGPPIPLTPQYWKEKEKRLFKKSKKRKEA